MQNSQKKCLTSNRVSTAMRAKQHEKRSDTMSITIENLNKQFGTYKALDNINLEVNSGELLALLGPSGCGKTSLLRIIGGMELADSGKLLFQPLSNPKWVMLHSEQPMRHDCTFIL
mgnify:CR=1 FL=1